MAENKLTMRRVEAARKPGYLSDGGGLHLQVTVNKSGQVNKSWVYRFLIHGKSREMGLGPLSDTNSLAEARAERNRWREVLKSGRDPIEEKERQRHSAALEASHTVSFQETVTAFMKANADRWRAKATADDWESELRHGMPILGKLPVRDIWPALVDQVLEPLWSRPVLGKRLRSRMEEVFDWCEAKSYRAPNSNVPLQTGRASPWKATKAPSDPLCGHRDRRHWCLCCQVKGASSRRSGRLGALCD
jgi:hypothetical protein